MDVIRNANILDKVDLLRIENHILGKKYDWYGQSQTTVTKLMVLVDRLRKYPEEKAIKIIEIYLKQPDIEVIRQLEWNALTICAYNIRKYPESQVQKFAKIMQLLLKHDLVQINYVNQEGTSAAHYVARNLNLLKLLIEYDANMNIKNEYYSTPLYYCKNIDKEEITKFMHHITLLNVKN